MTSSTAGLETPGSLSSSSSRDGENARDEERAQATPATARGFSSASALASSGKVLLSIRADNTSTKATVSRLSAVDSASTIGLMAVAPSPCSLLSAGCALATGRIAAFTHLGDQAIGAVALRINPSVAGSRWDQTGVWKVCHTHRRAHLAIDSSATMPAPDQRNDFRCPPAQRAACEPRWNSMSSRTAA